VTDGFPFITAAPNALTWIMVKTTAATASRTAVFIAFLIMGKSPSLSINFYADAQLYLLSFHESDYNIKASDFPVFMMIIA
jgi:hypothetical protein